MNDRNLNKLLTYALVSPGVNAGSISCRMRLITVSKEDRDGGSLGTGVPLCTLLTRHIHAVDMKAGNGDTKLTWSDEVIEIKLAQLA